MPSLSGLPNLSQDWIAGTGDWGSLLQNDRFAEQLIQPFLGLECSSKLVGWQEICKSLVCHHILEEALQSPQAYLWHCWWESQWWSWGLWGETSLPALQSILGVHEIFKRPPYLFGTRLPWDLDSLVSDSRDMSSLEYSICNVRMPFFGHDNSM